MYFRFAYIILIFFLPILALDNSDVSLTQKERKEIEFLTNSFFLPQVVIEQTYYSPKRFTIRFELAEELLILFDSLSNNLNSILSYFKTNNINEELQRGRTLLNNIIEYQSPLSLKESCHSLILVSTIERMFFHGRQKRDTVSWDQVRQLQKHVEKGSVNLKPVEKNIVFYVWEGIKNEKNEFYIKYLYAELFPGKAYPDLETQISEIDEFLVPYMHSREQNTAQKQKRKKINSPAGPTTASKVLKMGTSSPSIGTPSIQLAPQLDNDNDPLKQLEESLNNDGIDGNVSDDNDPLKQLEESLNNDGIDGNVSDVDNQLGISQNDDLEEQDGDQTNNDDQLHNDLEGQNLVKETEDNNQQSAQLDGSGHGQQTTHIEGSGHSKQKQQLDGSGSNSNTLENKSDHDKPIPTTKPLSSQQQLDGSGSNSDSLENESDQNKPTIKPLSSPSSSTPLHEMDTDEQKGEKAKELSFYFFTNDKKKAEKESTKIINKIKDHDLYNKIMALNESDQLAFLQEFNNILQTVFSFIIGIYNNEPFFNMEKFTGCEFINNFKTILAYKKYFYGFKRVMNYNFIYNPFTFCFNSLCYSQNAGPFIAPFPPNENKKVCIDFIKQNNNIFCLQEDLIPECHGNCLIEKKAPILRHFRFGNQHYFITCGVDTCPIFKDNSLAQQPHLLIGHFIVTKDNLDKILTAENTNDEIIEEDGGDDDVSEEGSEDDYDEGMINKILYIFLATLALSIFSFLFLCIRYCRKKSRARSNSGRQRTVRVRFINSNDEGTIYTF